MRTENIAELDIFVTRLGRTSMMQYLASEYDSTLHIN
jgi:hypothetical protein